MKGMEEQIAQHFEGNRKAVDPNSKHSHILRHERFMLPHTNFKGRQISLQHPVT